MLQSAHGNRKLHLAGGSDIAAPHENWVKARSSCFGPSAAPGCAALATGVPRSHPKMLAQLQALRLVVRADALAVEGVGPRQHFLVDQTADDLAVLEDERHLARAYFQNRARALSAGPRIAETGIEEAGIMHAELADQGIERHHLGGI